jgi:alkanesulfonate monooxygenase SsuD/methylene tetrahydromethanopterin reductase-like flavin-dependent oxidoreductase (luciferase family)
MPAPFRNPALAAMETATVARLFPGRFAPTFGHGVQPWMEQVGARAASPLTLLREHTAAVRALLHGERVDADGRYVRLDGVALDWPPIQPPPVLVGARGEKTLGLAGELADGIVLDDDERPDRALTPERLAGAVATARRARDASALAGAPFEVVAYVVLDDDAAGRAAALVEAGATTLAFQPPRDAPDPAEVLAAATATRAVLGG